MPKTTRYEEGEILEDGTITGKYVRNHMKYIPDEEADDFAIRIDGFLGRGLFHRVDERRDRRMEIFLARVKELRESGITPYEGRRILQSEGYPC